MAFTLVDYNFRKLAVSTDSTWESLADVCHKHYQDEDGDQYPLASTIEAVMENEASDNDYSDEEVAKMDWKNYIDSVADSVMHVNSPCVLNSRNKQITSYPRKVYARLEAIALAEGETYFNGEEYVHPVVGEKKNKGNTSSTKVKASYPGIYPSPTKSSPTRFVAYYRKDMRTIKIGFYNNEAEAIQAKKELLNIS